MGPIQSLEDFLGMLRRRALLMMLVSGIGIVAAAYSALQQGHIFEASAVIEIELPDVEDGAERLQLIEQRLMVRDNLISVIDEYGLFANLPGLSVSQKVNLLRESTSIEGIAAGRQGGIDGTISALIITARLGTPDQAAMVANDFATSIMEQGTRTSAERAQATLELYLSEEQRLSAEINALEAEIAEFKRENDALLPDSLATRRAEIMRLQERALDIDSTIAALRRDRELLGSEPSMAQIDDDLVDLSQERQVIADRVDALQRTIAQTPEVERTLNTFERRLQQLQDQFSLTTQRRAEAALGQRLDLDHQAERFELLETAIPPDHPIGTSRRNTVLAGAVASVGLAFALAFVLELLNPVIRNSAQMQRQLDLRPVVSIPYVQTAWERRRQHMMRLGSFILVALAVLIAASLALAQGF